MFKIIKEIEGIKSFKNFNQDLFFVKNKNLYKNEDLIANNVDTYNYYSSEGDLLYISQSKTIKNGKTISKSILTDSIFSNYAIYSSDLNLENFQLKYELINNNDFSTEIDFGHLPILKKGIIQEKFVLLCFENLIEKINRNSKLSEWKFQSIDNLKINKILDVFENKILIACSENIIIALNIDNGNIQNKWNELPNSQSFVLDKTKSKLIGALNKYYIELDLKSGEINYNDISSELKKYDIIFIKQLNDNPYTETHLFLTAMMEQHSNNKNWSYDCLFALNKETLKIDWIYKFEHQNLGTHTPKMTEANLFQLDNDNTLHIFEKNKI